MGQVGFPTLDEMPEGESFELLSTNTQSVAAMDGEVAKDKLQAIGRQFLPGAIFQAVEIFQQGSGVDFGRIVLLSKEAADVEE